MSCPDCGGKLIFYGTVTNSEESIFRLIYRCQNCGDASVLAPQSSKLPLYKQTK